MAKWRDSRFIMASQTGAAIKSLFKSKKMTYRKKDCI